MTVDFFLLEGLRAVPVEFGEWERLRVAHRVAFKAFCDGFAPEEPACELGIKKREAEVAARGAFLAWMKNVRCQVLFANSDEPKTFTER